MRIALMMEGQTERVFLPHLRRFLEPRLAGKMPRIIPSIYDGRIPAERKLKRLVELLLSDTRQPADAVIALTDVYTGTREFKDAADAKNQMRQWVGSNERFYPHVAQHDFEAWLLPYWDDICKLAGSNRNTPSPRPESVNHIRPPSVWIQEVFRTGTGKRSYVKTRDANKILSGKDLTVAANVCPELKSFLNTILTLCNSPTLP